MEETVEDGFIQRQFSHPMDSKQQTCCELNNGDEYEDASNNAYDAFHAVGIHGFLQDKPLSEWDAFAQYHID